MCDVLVPIQSALPFVVIGLVAFLYSIFMDAYLVPSLRAHDVYSDPRLVVEADPHIPSETVEELLAYGATMHCLLFLFMVSYVRAILTAPGAIPRTDRWRRHTLAAPSSPEEESIHEALLLMSPEVNSRVKHLVCNTQVADIPRYRDFLKTVPVVERKEFGALRFCKYCQLFKPDRSHHCKVCNECVLRMDHHCPWLVNCVGFHNYKFFYLSVFYAALSTIFYLFCMFDRLLEVFSPILDTGYFLKNDLWVVVACLVCFIFGCFVWPFWYAHTMMIFSNLTTIEKSEKSSVDNVPDSKKDSAESIYRRFVIARMKFDRGLYANLCSFLGPFYVWLLPLVADSFDDGTYTYDSERVIRSLSSDSDVDVEIDSKEAGVTVQ